LSINFSLSLSLSLSLSSPPPPPFGLGTASGRNCRGVAAAAAMLVGSTEAFFFWHSTGLSGDYFDSFQRMLGTRHSPTRKLSTLNDGAVSAAACKLSTSNKDDVSVEVCKLSTHTDGAARAPRAATPLSAATCVAGLTEIGFFSASESFTLPRQ